MINLPLLERLYSDATAADMHADLDRIRSELRLGQRRSYGLDGLALARRFRN